MGKIAWGITGAGHLLRESLTLARSMEGVDVFMSPAGAEVLKMYGEAAPDNAIADKSASGVACRGFAAGKYDLMVVAPATSNSVAKFVYGISDSLVSTLFAQAGKCRVPIAVLPTDIGEVIDTMGATKPVKIYPRPIDLENVEKLRRFPGVKVAGDIQELTDAIAELLSWKR